MDLELKLSYREQNDNKALVLTDDSNWGEFGDIIGNEVGTNVPSGVLYEIYANGFDEDFSPYGAAGNTPGNRFVTNAAFQTTTDAMLREVTPYPEEVTAATLDVKITTPDGEESTTYTIDLFAEFGPFTSTDDMVYTIDASYLGGNSGDLLVDGLYDLVYTVTYTGNNQNDSTTVTATPLDVIVLVYGQVKVEVYDKLRQIPVKYACKNISRIPYINEADLYAAYLSSIETSAYVAKTEELLTMLTVLQNMIKNGSNINW